MFENKRESYVYGEVYRLTNLLRAESYWLELAPPHITDYLRVVRESVPTLDLKTHAIFESSFDQESPEYMLHVLEHGYHMLEIHKRIDLIEELFEQRFLPTAHYGVRDQLVAWRLVGLMSFIDGQIDAMKRKIY